MRKTYLLWFAFLAILMVGCRSEDFTNQSANATREEEFFRANLKNLSEDQRQILTYLRKENSKKDFVNHLNDKVGLPVWDKMVVQTEVDVENLSKANAEEETYMVIPVAKDEDELSSVIYAKKINGAFEFHNITNDALRNFVFDTGIAIPVREEVLMSYLFADHYVYGTQHFVRLPNDLFPQFIKNGRLSMKSVTTNGKFDLGHSDGSPGTSKFAVPIWECLELRDVNKCGCQTLVCDMCPACVSSYCSIIWVSGGGSGGEGPGSPGGNGGDTGGGTGGGTDCSTGGWYKIIPDGCGNGENPEPETEPSNPCDKIKLIGKDPKTKALMKGLKTKTNQNVEYGYMLNKQNGQVNETAYVGDPDTHDLYIDNTETNGYIHSHDQDALSIFSPDDLFTLAALYKSGNIKDLGSFVMGVATNSGTQYYITIDDVSKFDSFAQNLFEGNVFDKDILENYRNIYSKFFKINESNNITTNESKFLDFVIKGNAGLKIFKGSDDMNTWKLLNKDENGNVVPQNCP